ncbi:stress-response A/B barrel domain-containing protein At5g22580-like [Tasmannia lanceolata]|uniref:stress-response A/B barrel domain-containing protein At5g22580-like n=1 Tax=Tasmannia lanceolata TaxID=3420 RepID=UPI004063A664
MGEMKHLVLVKFKEGVQVEDILKGLDKMASEIDVIKSYDWGQDSRSDKLKQGFTHAFSMTFSNEQDLNAYLSHPIHTEFKITFTAAIEKIVLLDFPIVIVKSPT